MNKFVRLAMVASLALACVPLTLQAAPGQPGEATAELEKLNDQVVEAFQAGKYDKALPLLERMKQIQPNNPVISYNLACAQSRLGKPGEAIKSLTRAVELGWRDAGHTEADEDLQPLRNTPEYKALLARMQGKTPTPQAPKPADPPKDAPKPEAPKPEAPKPADPPKPTNPQEMLRELESLNRQVIEAFQAKKYDKALPLLERMVQLQPKHPVMWYNLACAQSRLGRQADAIKSLTRAVELGWRDVEHLEADEDLQPLRGTPEYKALVARLRGGKPEEEKPQPPKPDATKPDAPKPPDGPKPAEPTTRPQPPTQPQPPHGPIQPGIPGLKLTDAQRKALGMMKTMERHFQNKEYEKARDLAHKILELDPDNNTSWYNLACAHSRLGNIPEALACLHMAVQKGYTAFRHMENDPDLAVLRWSNSYKQLVARKDEVLRAHADKMLAMLKEKMGPDYICEADYANKMIFATNVDRRMLDEVKGVLTSYAQALWRELFTNTLEEFIVVVVPKQWANPMIGGFYNHAGKTLVCKSVGMVMVHEFTHALHFADQDGLGQQHPIWIIEGLSTLFETSSLANGQVVCEPNHRLNVIKDLVEKNQTIPWTDFFKLSHPGFMQQANTAYSQARAIMMYLREQGLLKKFYDNYTDGFAGDATGIKAIEKTCGKDLGQIEADWKAWVRRQTPVVTRIQAKQACLGVMLEPASEGLKIMGVMPGGGADKAGLKVGDLIVKADGERIVDQADLLQVVSRRKVGDQLKLEVRRDGKYQEVTVTLGEMPEQPMGPTTRPATRPATQPATQPASQPATRPVRNISPRRMMKAAAFVDREAVAGKELLEELALAPAADKRRQVLADLFRQAGLTDVTQQEIPGKPGCANVVAVLPGQSGETILVGAHFDFHPAGRGVVDNWTGACMITNLAQALARQERTHTFIFVGFDLEEVGLVGSKHYLSTLPAERLGRLKAMICLDSLGVSDTRIIEKVTTPELGDLARQVGEHLKVPLDQSPQREGTSDSAVFIKAGVPTLTLCSLRKEDWKFLHSAGDQLSAVNKDRYQQQYRLTLAILRTIDANNN